MSRHFRHEDGFGYVECPMRTEVNCWCPPDECRKAYPGSWCEPTKCGKCTKYVDGNGNVVVGKDK